MSRYSGPGQWDIRGFSWSGSPRQRVRAIKRLEAEERNAKTPDVRRKAFRRAFADENGTVPTAVPAENRKKRGKKNAAD